MQLDWILFGLFNKMSRYLKFNLNGDWVIFYIARERNCV